MREKQGIDHQGMRIWLVVAVSLCWRWFCLTDRRRPKEVTPALPSNSAPAGRTCCGIVVSCTMISLSRIV
jgi:hypothetical protein